jgi:hypothetical protein
MPDGPAMSRLHLWLLLTTVACATTPPGKSADRPLVWEVRRADAPGVVWLAGTMHLRAPDSPPLDRALVDALARSQELVLEADTSDASAMAAYLIAERPLPAVLTEDTRRAFDEAVQGLGLDPTQLYQLSPWMAALTLVQIQAQRAGYRPELGVEHRLTEEARRRGLEIRYLETVEEQIRVFADMSPELQDQFLSATLTELEDGAAPFRALDEAYAAGDVDRLDRLSRENADADGLDEFNRRLLDERNLRFLAGIESRVAREGTSMVAVGAAHMGGDGGLLRLLKKRGYRVQRAEARGPVPPLPPAALAWTKVQDAELGFSIEFPQSPTRQTFEPEGPNGFSRSVYFLDQGGAAYSFAVLSFPPSVGPRIRDRAAQVFQESLAEVAKEVNGEIQSVEVADLDGAPGRLARIKYPLGRLTLRLVIRDHRIYEQRAALQDALPADDPHRNAAVRYLDSLRLVDDAASVGGPTRSAWVGGRSTPIPTGAAG